MGRETNRKILIRVDANLAEALDALYHLRKKVARIETLSAADAADTKKILNTEGAIMAQQDRLNADVEAATAALTQLEQQVADLKNQPGAEQLDFSALDSFVSRLQGDVTPPAPVEPTDGTV